MRRNSSSRRTAAPRNSSHFTSSPSSDEEEKARIVGLLWKIAYADGRLHMYEDSLVLKISDLLHVSRGRVMRLKHDAQAAAN